LQENPIDKISKRKEPKQLPRTLTREHVKELISSLENIFDKQTFT
jgi:site-specific recombinase XerD